MMFCSAVNVQASVNLYAKSAAYDNNVLELSCQCRRFAGHDGEHVGWAFSITEPVRWT